MDIRPIRTQDDLDWALAEIAVYFDGQPAPGTPEADRFDVLAELIEAYEDKHHPIPDLDPVDLIKAHMAAAGRTQRDLAEILGSASRASEVLNRKRGLSVEMIYKISKGWRLPADGMVRPYHLKKA